MSHARAYYNEIDPFAAAWLRNLISAGHIAKGEVDERSIVEVRPADLAGYVQCHFFAGLGGWSYALRLAGWRDDRPVWTVSCPCQPLSSAGQRKGHADRRHLWPAFHGLIAECAPPVVFGEQVASKDGREWFAAVRADLEALGYACGAADLCAAGVGAPHIRQRLWFVADSRREHSSGRRELRDLGSAALSHEGASEERERFRNSSDNSGADGWLADADGGHAGTEGLQRSGEHGQRPQDCGAGSLEHAASEQVGLSGRARQPGDATSELGDADDARPQGRSILPERARERSAGPPSVGHWSDIEWLPCRDGMWRPTQSGIQPLAHGVSARVGKLRAAGNAIVPQVAAEFIGAWLDMRASP